MTEAATPDVPRVIPAPEALAFLERAGALLAGSLDYEETLRRVAQLAVPDLADWCGVLIRGDDGDTRELTSGHPDPEQEALLVAMRRRRRERDGASESMKVIETGRPQALEPMSASDRKVVHDVAAEIEGVATESEGEDPRRRVVLRRA